MGYAAIFDLKIQYKAVVIKAMQYRYKNRATVFGAGAHGCSPSTQEPE